MLSPSQRKGHGHYLTLRGYVLRRNGEVEILGGMSNVYHRNPFYYYIGGLGIKLN